MTLNLGLAGAVDAQDSQFDTDLFGLIEFVHQDDAITGGAAVPTLAPNGAVVPGATTISTPSDAKTDSARFRVGVGYDHRLRWGENTVEDAIHVEQARSFAGEQLDLTGTGMLADHWAGPRLGLDGTLTESAGRYLNSAIAPISEVLGANFGNSQTYYRQQVATAGTTYALTRLLQIYATIDVSSNYGLGITTLGEGITAGTRIYHTTETTSRLQVGVRKDWAPHTEPQRTESASYRIDHKFSREDTGNIEIGEDVVFTPGTGRSASINYNVNYAHTSGDTTVSAFAGRNLGRRPITNEQTLNDTGGGTFIEKWKPTHQTLTLTAMRTAERDVFNQSGLSTETIDTGRIEHAIGVYQRIGFPAGRDYDRLVFYAQEERAHSVLGDVRRETLGVGYYATL